MWPVKDAMGKTIMQQIPINDSMPEDILRHWIKGMLVKPPLKWQQERNQAAIMRYFENSIEELRAFAENQPLPRVAKPKKTDNNDTE